jgi:hypothetical protein
MGIMRYSTFALLVAIYAGVTLPLAAQAPHPNSLAAQVAAPWRHLPKPASDQKFKQDKAKCSMMGQMAPVGAGSPEIKFLSVFVQCMRAEGYEPVLPNN